MMVQPSGHTSLPGYCDVVPGRVTRPLGLPFAHLNLRRNPFGEVDLCEQATLALVELDEVAQRLKQPGFAVQFMGPCGRGKTTHLVALRAMFPSAAYVHIGLSQAVRIPRGDPLLLDEAQRLPKWRRWWIFRRFRRLALGTHEDLSLELRRAGWEVETIDVASRLDAARLCVMLNRRIEAARRNPGPIPVVSPATAQSLLRRFGDDLRAIQGHLYDRFQTLAEIGHV